MNLTERPQIYQATENLGTIFHKIYELRLDIKCIYRAGQLLISVVIA